ncbi:MAG: hypothetical protein HZA58_01010 [Acidimicrobiia bacterium]|nr:hypothetical protein [Acidimicrobiia bacterium]
MDTVSSVVEGLTDRGLIRTADGTVPDLQALDEAIAADFVEIDVVRVKVWDASGNVIYSDLAELIDQTFPLSPHLAAAFRGVPRAAHSALTGDAHLTERALGHQWEFLVPVTGDSGAVVAVVEVYEIAATFHEYLSSMRAWVWFGVGAGLAVLFVFNVSLVAANSRVLNRRREQAERLLSDLARAQEEERSRIIGALHDDIGQPLYRVLYGIEGSRSQVDPASPVAAELGRVAGLVRWIDGTLRSELGMLHQGLLDRLDLDARLARLADDIRSESRVEISLKVGEHAPLSEVAQATLFRAAREAVTNAQKHAAATKLTITVTRGSHRTILDVEDDGTGFRGELGLGLATTQSRLEALGGGLRVVKREGGGTLFRAWVPDEERGKP